MKSKPKKKLSEAGDNIFGLVSCFCFFLTIIIPWNWRRHVPPKRPALSELHSVKPRRPHTSLLLLWTYSSLHGYHKLRSRFCVSHKHTELPVLLRFQGLVPRLVCENMTSVCVCVSHANIITSSSTPHVKRVRYRSWAELHGCLEPRQINHRPHRYR
jgi:hypothetical protein